MVKSPRANAGDTRVTRRVQFPGQEDPLEEGMAVHSSIPAWRISWTEEPGGLQSLSSVQFSCSVMSDSLRPPAQ